MITKIYFPSINTDSIVCDSNIKISNEEYDKLVANKIYENRSDVESYLKYGNTGIRNNFQQNSNVKDYIMYSPFEAYVTQYNPNSSNNSVNDYFFEDAIINNKMVLLNININPNSFEDDAESEVKMWVGESIKIHNDKQLDNKTKMSYLPSYNLKMELTDGRQIYLNECKIIKDISSKNSPLNILIIVNNLSF